MGVIIRSGAAVTAHASTHAAGQSDPFLHQAQHQAGGGDAFAHQTQHLRDGTDPVLGAWQATLATRFLMTVGATAGTLTLTDQQMRAAAILVARTTTFDRIAIEVTAGGAGGTPVIRLGIYRTEADGTPGTLVLDAGTVDGTVVAVATITINQQLTPGLYWLACVPQGATVTQPTIRNQSTNPLTIVSEDTANWANTPNAYQRSAIAGALPDPFGSDSLVGTGPRMGLRVA